MGRAQDEKSEYEFHHPAEARSMSYAPEAAEERNRASYCQPCKDKGRTQMAHRVLPGRRGICNWCYRGEPHPEELRTEKGKRKKEKGKSGRRAGDRGANVCGGGRG